METKDIDSAITRLLAELKKLEPTLKPTDAIPWSKVGLLNTARKREKKIKEEILVLQMVKKFPVPDAVLNMLLGYPVKSESKELAEGVESIRLARHPKEVFVDKQFKPFS